MNFDESYEKYLVLAEANGTTDKLSTNKGRYAIKYNIAQNKVVEWLIESNGTDENRYLQKIKKVNTPLIKLRTSEEYTEFEIPKDYFDFINLRVGISKDQCRNQKIKVQEVKGENVHLLYNDPNSEPSFKYRESFYTIAQNAVQVYKKKFEVDTSDMSYYRYPIQVELENKYNPESQFKKTELDFDDKLINRIILATVALHELSSDDPKYQAFKQETIQKF